MEPGEILDHLVELAREAGIDVRVLGRGGVDVSPESAVVRVRGELWVVLAEADLPEQRIAVLARALREHAGPLLEGRYLPPALRDLLDAG
ncbi:MAG TPA: hypothetical protein VKB65_09475 [Myxococcota bacterium]|nr:hypothetical protein [Myxococcota bacterium]